MEFNGRLKKMDIEIVNLLIGNKLSANNGLTKGKESSMKTRIDDMRKWGEKEFANVPEVVT